MHLSRRGVRPVAAVLVASLLLVGGWSAPRSGRGDETAPRPSEPDLLKSPPFDRITLTDGTVLEVEPVSPRPLPPVETKKKAEEPPVPKRERASEKRSGRRDRRKAEKEEKPEEPKLAIRLLHGEVRDFLVKRSNIKSIEYYEDLLLAQGDRMVQAHDYARAFEHYLAVRTRNPSWPGIEPRVDRLLFEEGSAALIDGDTERGLRLLRELHARQPKYQGLGEKLAASYVGRVDKAFDAGAYTLGRKVLHEVEELAPENVLVQQARDRFIQRARALVDEAKTKSGAERLDALAEALRVWPALEEAEGPFAEAFRELPTLDVAVTDLPRQFGPFPRSPAAERSARLVYLPLLAEASQAALEGKPAGQLADRVEVGDLGRRLTLRLRRGLTWSDGSRPVSAIDPARALADRADPFSAGYQARWAEVLEAVTTPGQDRVEVRLNRTLLQPEAWLLGPIGPAHAGADGWVTTSRGRLPVGDGPYRWESATSELVRFRAVGERGSAGTPKILRIREARFPGAQAMLGAFARGEVTLLEHVPHVELPALAKQKDVRIGRYRSPRLHRIALDGRNPALRNRNLQRALSYVLDRKTLLEENVLRQPADEVNTVSDGPFAKGSFADAPGVPPLRYDPLLARGRVIGARKELGGGPIRLTFEYPAIPEVQAVAPRIAEAFRSLGLEIKAIERPESELEEALRAGRRFDLAYRTSACSDPVFEAGPLLCPGYDAPPSTDSLASVASPRILQLLIQLERTSAWPVARGLAIQIDREARDELPVIPLWQLEDHYAWRTRLTGPGEATGTLYQGIESWEIVPWFARDPW